MAYLGFVLWALEKNGWHAVVEFCTHSIALVGGGGVTSPVSLLIFLPSYLLVVDCRVEIPPSVLIDFAYL